MFLFLSLSMADGSSLSEHALADFDLSLVSVVFQALHPVLWQLPVISCYCFH